MRRAARMRGTNRGERGSILECLPTAPALPKVTNENSALFARISLRVVPGCKAQ